MRHGTIPPKSGLLRAWRKGHAIAAKDREKSGRHRGYVAGVMECAGGIGWVMLPERF